MISFKNVSKTYASGKHAVRDFDLEIADGEFVFIVGRSGAGKSTLFRLLTRELQPDTGTIRVNGCLLSEFRRGDLPFYRRRLGVVYQDFRLLQDRSIFENIAVAMRITGASPREIREKVPRLLKLTGLSSRYKNFPNELSGGEQQRAAIARALVNDPDLILADEPTGNLDEQNARDIMDLLCNINSRGTTVVVITHSIAFVNELNKRVVTMDRGAILADTGILDPPAVRASRRGMSRRENRDA